MTAIPEKTPNPWAATVLLLMGNFMNLIDVSIVNVALPSIRDALQASETQIEWISAAYVMTFAVGLLPCGRFGDKLGRRRLFLWGVTMFTLASALCGFAPNVEVLIASRALQGVGGAMMVPQVMAIMHVIFRPEEKARAFALAGVIISLGAVTGPLLGGLLITVDLWGLDWRPIFLVNLPFGIIVVLGGLRLIPRLIPESAMRIDWLGVFLFASAISLVVLPVVEGPLLGWPSWTIAALALTLPVAALFLRRQASLERQGREQLLPVMLLKDRGFLSGILIVMLHFSAIPGMFLVYAIYLQTGFDFTPLQSGLATAPFPLGVMTGSYITGRFGTRWIPGRIALGAGILLCGMTWLRHMVGNPPADLHLWTFAPPLAINGLGMGLAISPLFQLVLRDVPGRIAGAATGTMQALQQVGAAIGIAIVSGLFFVRLQQDGYPQALNHALGYQVGVFATILSILALRWILMRERRA
ncbi:MFS transporter [Paracoccus sp. 1_MG-2023]|uniref:MFS transporter n=1 Tax=unclassified Paracoccus (in: a-proteobacteria) TaxID=2688777 RepID=UPI001C092F64|nr:MULTISPECIES: MFS transporter [unclassified Paracoccus (in: a-proteobacteria)]MBU2958756.1 MFS transporter [Paracoccus sp. C2R09]MDO6667749.1 MFS transporter [Paracoccus sp. 1_MG-2023]